MSEALLEVRNLVKHFPIGGGMFTKPVGVVRAIDGVSFTIRKGETLGLVGESGCGKTTTGRCILQLEQPTSGSVVFEGIDMVSLDAAELRAVRRRVQVIFQDPYSSLNPRMTIGQILAEPLKVHGLVRDKGERELRVRELLTQVGLLPQHAKRYPHQLSGGEQQRVSVARAFVNRPLIMLADEPTGNLDPATGEGIMRLLDRINKTGTTVVMATHDQRIVNTMRKRVIQLDRGVIVRDQARGVYE